MEFLKFHGTFISHIQDNCHLSPYYEKFSDVKKNLGKLGNGDFLERNTYKVSVVFEL